MSASPDGVGFRTQQLVHPYSQSPWLMSLQKSPMSYQRLLCALENYFYLLSINVWVVIIVSLYCRSPRYFRNNEGRKRGNTAADILQTSVTYLKRVNYSCIIKFYLLPVYQMSFILGSNYEPTSVTEEFAVYNYRLRTKRSLLLSRKLLVGFLPTFSCNFGVSYSMIT